MVPVRGAKAECTGKKNQVCDESGDASSYDYNEYAKFFDSEHFRLVSCANCTFGSNAWSHSITKQDIDCIDYNEGKYSVGAVAVVKVELKEGPHHEELGYGSCFGLRNKIISISVARQEAILNALKRALVSFGSVTQSDITPITPEVSVGEKVDPSWRKNLGLKERASQIACGGGNNMPHTSKSVQHQFPAYPSNEKEQKAERKRKQHQMQEEYKRRMLLIEPSEQSFHHLKENVGQGDTGEDEDSFISTQELDEMIKSAAAQGKSSSSHRAPLLSSPLKSSNGGWLNTGRCPAKVSGGQMF